MNLFRILTKLLPICAGLLLLSGCAIWTGGLPTSYNTKGQYPIISSIHGIKTVTNSADLHEVVISYSPASEITLNTNTEHGWRIQINPSDKQIKGQEFYILPKPARWDTKYGFISIDKTTCFRNFIVPKGVKYINGSWGMFPDDPLGGYQIAVLLDDKRAAEFNFRVIAGTNVTGALKNQGK